MICPKCGSPDLVRSGKKIMAGGPVQAYTCKSCGWRGRIEGKPLLEGARKEDEI